VSPFWGIIPPGRLLLIQIQLHLFIRAKKAVRRQRAKAMARIPSSLCDHIGMAKRAKKPFNSTSGTSSPLFHRRRDSEKERFTAVRIC
jgi:hypothetical protein